MVHPGFEDNANGQATGWSRYGEGYDLVREGRDGGWCIRCRSETGRQTMGAAWFDDLRVSLAPQRFTRTTALGGFAGAGRIEALASVSLPSTWQTQVRHGERVVFTQQGEGPTQRISWNGRDAEGRAVPPGRCTIRFTATDRLLGETVTWNQEVDTTAAQSGRNYALWTESSMRRVMPVDLPETNDPPAALALSAARNEYESGQIVIMPPSGVALKNVRVTISDLAGANGARIASDNVQWHQVGYVWVEHQHEHPDVPRYGPCWWPDPLLPVKSFDVDPGWAQPVWITVHVPEGTPPGTYTGRVTLSADGNPGTTVPLHLRVHDFTVPTRGHLKTAFALMQGYLEKVHGVRNVTPKLRQAYGDFLLSHRLNPDDITRTELPFLEDIARYHKRGLNAFNVLNLVEPRGSAPWRCWSPAEAYTPDFKQRLISTLDPFVADLKARGLADWAYIYSFDERPKESHPIIREYFGMIQQRYGLPTLTTAMVPQDPAVMRDLNVDWNCPMSDVYSFADAERCRAAGLQVWSYVCCVPRAPFANFLADDPLLEARLNLWALGQKRGDRWSARSDCEPVTTSLTAFTHDPFVLLAARERIARELSEGGTRKP